MKYFYLTSSEIAKLTGHNQYEPLDKVVKNLLNKFGIKASYIPKSNIEEGLRKLSPSQVSELEQELDKLRGSWTPEKTYPVRDTLKIALSLIMKSVLSNILSIQLNGVI